jgi:phage terminase large subunit-like protein
MAKKQKPKVESEYYFDEVAATRPAKFIERYCTHVEGPMQGQKIQLMDYHRDLIAEVFGWKKKADGYRRYRYVYQEIPKKNAKSTLLAALGLYLTGFDGEKGAQVYAVAGDKDQARIIFDAARVMVEQNKDLSRVFNVQVNRIKHKKSNSYFKVLSSEVKTKHGPNIHAVLFDEMHVQEKRDLWDTLTKGVANRLQPLVFAITTAGFTGTFAHEMHQKCKAIADGKINSKFWYVKMFNIDQERAYKDYDKESVWKEVNPGYGITVQKDFFESEMELISQNPSNLTSFLRLHLNVWTGSERTWDIYKYWNRGDIQRLDEASMEGRECYMGVDLASVDDTSAVVLIFPNETGDYFDIITRFFIPKDTLDQRRRNENDEWYNWVAQGIARTTDGDTTKEEEIREEIEKLANRFKVKLIGCDPWNAHFFITKLIDEGFPAAKYPQNRMRVSPPLKFIERHIKARAINHQGNPILKWQAGNVVITEDVNENRMPNKEKSTSRIDGISAMITAFGTYLAAIAEPEKKLTAADILGEETE